MKKFISLEEAIEILDNNVNVLNDEEINLINGVGRVASDDIYSKIDNPHFNKSAMDGFAIKSEDTLIELCSLMVIDEVFAGEVCKSTVISNTAIKIMTGAQIPDGADAVIKQEDVIIEDENIIVNKVMKANENICFKGEDIKKGQILVKKNKKLDYADIGILASAGISDFRVYKKPKIAIISTGDELFDIDSDLEPGKIYNSNKYSLIARVKELGYDISFIKHIEDDAYKIGSVIKEIADDIDLIVTTGGASVGEKDLINKAIEEIQGEKLFWKIKIKPGSAVLCSKYKKSLVISLSGNPTAALTTFELLVKTTIEKMSGLGSLLIKREKAILIDDFNKSSPQRRFIRGRFTCSEIGQKVSITQIKSGNGILSSALNSNCIIELDAGNLGISKGNIVDIIKL